MKVLDWLYSLALNLYPRNFRARFGREMRQVFRTRCTTAPRLAPVLISTICDLIATSFRERLDAMMTPRFARRFAYIAATAVLFLAASAAVVRAYVIPTPSMEPTLVPGDHLIVDRLARTPQSQQLVVFRYPPNPSQYRTLMPMSSVENYLTGPGHERTAQMEVEAPSQANPDPPRQR